jgi:hypothetical protein
MIDSMEKAQLSGPLANLSAIPSPEKHRENRLSLCTSVPLCLKFSRLPAPRLQQVGLIERRYG